MDVKVSVIIPVFNAEKYLSVCLDSIINQTLKEIEIICVDDASTDKTLNILRDYEKTDNRFIVLHNKTNMRQAYSRNRALDIAKGQYIQYVDADDYIELDTIADNYKISNTNALDVLLLNHFIHTRVDSYRCSSYYMEEDYVVSGITMCERLNYRFGLATWNFFVRRDFLNDNEIRFKAGNSVEDVLIAYYMLKKAKRVMCNRKPNYHYLHYNSFVTGDSDKNVIYYSMLSNIYEIVKEGIKEQYTSNFIGMMQSRLLHNRRISRVPINHDGWDKELIVFEKMLFGPTYVDAMKIYKEKDIYKSFKYIFIYGAGNVACQLIEELNRNQIPINGVIVTKKTKDFDFFYGHKIYEIDELKVDKRRTLILLAFWGSDKEIVIRKLKESLFTNCINVTDDSCNI